MNIYRKVPEQFHKQYLETISMLSEPDRGQIVPFPQKRKSSGKTWLRRIGYTGATAAAVFMAALILCAANPSLASELPVIGTIFHAMQNRFGFGQIPEDRTVILAPEEPLSSPDAAQETGQPDTEYQNPYQATDNGITLSVEEYYATNQAVFLGIRMVTEEPLPQDLTDTMIFLSTETYSFRADDPHRGNWNFEFERIDDHTFLGIMRIDYATISKDLRQYTEAVKKAEAAGRQAPVLSAETESQYVSYYDIPETFDLDIAFTSLWIYHAGETAGMSKQSIKGSWNIAGIPIQQNAYSMQTISVKEVNADGFGIDRIELSPLEMTIYPVKPADHDTFAVVLDKDGQMLHSGGNNCYQLAVQGHDISEITIYICDYVEYMDEIKGYALSADPNTLKEILEEKNLYQTSMKINN